MSHWQQREWCEYVRSIHPSAFMDKMVLDAGSLNINGDNRFLFSGGWYLGVDVAPGRNVDLVSMIHELTFVDGLFDTIVSTEAAEHDCHWQRSLPNIVRMLKSGGIFLFTCATTGRAVHGTIDTTPHDAPGIPWNTYYRNLTEDDIRSVLDCDALFSQYEFKVGNDTHDLYFYGVKR